MILVDEVNDLYRGPRPKDLGELKGIKRIINLESGVYSTLHPDGKIMRQFPADYGMTEFNLPCSDITPPEDWVVEKVITLVCHYIEPTYIHCLSGVDRTGYVCAAYRMRVQGWSYGAAVAEWTALGRHPWYFWWGQRLKRWSK